MAITKLTIAVMAGVFERLDRDDPIKVIAYDLGVTANWLGRKIERAARLGFVAFAGGSSHRDPTNGRCVTGNNALELQLNN